MDLKKTGTSSADTEEVTSKPEEPLKTPSRPGKGVKRKHQSPATPSSSKSDVGSAKKRRKSASGTPLGWSASPGTGTPLKPPMTERQQMALLLQMTDPQKQASVVDQSPSSSNVEVTPKSRTQRRNERGETPLHIACIKGDLKTATSLVEQGAEVDSVDNAGWTPLHEACNHGHVVIVEMLLQRGAKVNVRGMEGDTPMHDAVVNRHLECVKLLLEYGGDPTLANEKGLTPIEMAEQHPEILKVLSTNIKDDSEPDVFESSDEKPPSDENVNRKSVDEENPIAAISSSSKCEPDKSETNMISESGSSPVLKEMGTNDGDTESKMVAQSRKRGRGLVFSDVSSSESESEHSEVITRRGGKRSRLSFPDPKQQLEKLSEAEESVCDLKEKSLTVEKEEESRDKKGEDKSSETQSEDVCAMETTESSGIAPPNSPPDNTLPSTKDHGKDKTKGHEEDKTKDHEENKTKGHEEDKTKDHEEDKTKDHEEDKTKDHEEDKTKDHEEDRTKAAEIQSKLHVPSSSERDQPRSSPLSIKPMTLDHSKTSEEKISGSQEQLKQPTLLQSDEKKLKREINQDTELPSVTDTKHLHTAVAAVSSRAHLSRAVKSPQPSLIMRNTRSSLIVSYSLSMIKLSGQEAVARHDGDTITDRGISGKLESQEGSLRSVELSDLSEQQVKDKDSLTKENFTAKLDSRLQIHDSISERRDSTSSQDSRCSASGEKHTKHSRKPQHVFPSRKLTKKEEVKTKSEADETSASNSFSISLDWGVLNSPQQPPKSGGLSPKLIVQSSGPSSTLHVHSGGKRMCSDNEEKNDDSDTSKSTVISLSTSLPIVFSGLRDTQHTVTTSSSNTPPKDSKLQQQQQPPQQHPSQASPDWNPVKETLTTPSSVKPKTLPIILESVKSSSAPSTPQKKERNSNSGLVQPSTVSTASMKDNILQSEIEDIQVNVMPPKRRHRLVYRSTVAQQRRIKQEAPPTKPAHMSSFLMSSGNYHSKKVIQPTNPKSVYPPMSTALYKLFNEQESERVKLMAAHLSEQDRMVISMEQEVLRAHQRAIKSHTVVSACSLLLEQLLPRSHHERSARGNGVQLGSDPPITETEGSSPSSSSKQKEVVAMEMLDSKLLSGLIQDVWDKFYQLKFTLITRQRHEAEALWLVQRSVWMEKLTEIGFSKSNTDQDVHVPSTHVPLASSRSLIEN